MGDTFNWNIPATGGTFDWGDPADWTDETSPPSSKTGVPGSLDTAFLNGPINGDPETIVGPGNAATLVVAGVNVMVGSFVTGLTEIASTGGGGAVLDVRGSLSGTSLLVGEFGTGTLTVEAGAQVSAASATGGDELIIGTSLAATGLVSVYGTLDLTGPSESTQYSLIVGEAGSGTLVVSGSGATLNGGGDALDIADQTGSSGSVTISGGATVAVAGGAGGGPDAAVAIGHAGSGTLVVTGAASELLANGVIFVGRASSSALLIEAGGLVDETSSTGQVGIGVGNSSGVNIGGTGTAIVSTAGTLAASGSLVIGGNGVSGLLEVSDGLVDATGRILIGVGTTIGGSLYTGAGTLDIGADGTVEVLGAGHANTLGLVVASAQGSVGDITVSGAGARLDVGANDASIGQLGTALVSISAGATFAAASAGGTDAALIVGNNAAGTGTLSVDDATVTANGTLVVGNAGAGTLFDTDGATVGAAALVIGNKPTGHGTVTVSGTGSSLSVLGTLAISATLGAAGTLAIGAGAMVDALSGTIGAGGVVLLEGGVFDIGTTLDLLAGGQVSGTGTLDGAVSGGGTIAIAAGGDVVFEQGVGSGVIIDFSTGAGRADLDAVASFAATIGTIGVGDTIFALGATSLAYDGGNLIELFDSFGSAIGTIGLAQTFAAGSFLDQGGTITVACYCAGTRILTDCGEVAVEDLQIGDGVVTLGGAVRRLRWLGHRRHDARFVAAHREVLPILIRAGALADGMPRRDLRVSPEHAMFLDGVLIPAKQLLNGRSIVRDMAATEVSYWHIELDCHDILFAEGAAAESFIDQESRGLFENAAEFGAQIMEACAARVEEGEVLEAVRRRLAGRAASCNPTSTQIGLAHRVAVEQRRAGAG